MPPPLYFALQNTGEECGYIHCRRAEVFSALPPPSPYGHSPYISSKTPRNVTGHGRERVVTTVAGFFNPSVTSCHLLYILHYKTQGRRTEMSRNAIEYEREGGAPLFLTALFLAELI